MNLFVTCDDDDTWFALVDIDMDWQGHRRES